MKKVALILFCLGILLFTLNTAEAGPIKLKVFGKGGIVQTPDGYTYICPNQSSMVCTDVLVEGVAETNTLNGLNGTLNYNGQSYQVEIVTVEILYIEGENYHGQGLVVRGNIK